MILSRVCRKISHLLQSTFRTLSALYAPTTRELIRKHWQRPRYKFWGERCFCTTLRRAHNYKFDMVAKKNEHGGRKCKATKKDTITSGPFWSLIVLKDWERLGEEGEKNRESEIKKGGTFWLLLLQLSCVDPGLLWWLIVVFSGDTEEARRRDVALLCYEGGFSH